MWPRSVLLRSVVEDCLSHARASCSCCIAEHPNRTFIPAWRGAIRSDQKRRHDAAQHGTTQHYRMILLTSCYILLTTYHLPHITYHLLLTTYHSLLTTDYLPLTTCHLLLTTYSSPLTTYYLLLTTYYLLLAVYCLLLTAYSSLLDLPTTDYLPLSTTTDY